jgi:hypothetical protein
MGFCFHAYASISICKLLLQFEMKIITAAANVIFRYETILFAFTTATILCHQGQMHATIQETDISDAEN